MTESGDFLVFTPPDLTLAKSVRLYSNPICPFSQRVRLSLRDKQVDFSQFFVHLIRKPEWFLQLNPHGTTPTLEHKGQIIPDSKICMEYVDECFPSDRRLLSPDPMERAQQKIFVEEFGGQFLPHFFKILKAGDPDQSGFTGIKNYLAYFNEFLNKREMPLISGELPGFPDFAVYPFFERLEGLGTVFSKDLSVWLQDSAPQSVPLFFEFISAMQKQAPVQATALTSEQHAAHYKSFKEGCPKYSVDSTTPIYAAPPR